MCKKISGGLPCRLGFRLHCDAVFKSLSFVDILHQLRRVDLRQHCSTTVSNFQIIASVFSVFLKRSTNSSRLRSHTERLFAYIIALGRSAALRLRAAPASAARLTRSRSCGSSNAAHRPPDAAHRAPPRCPSGRRPPSGAGTLALAP